MRREAGIHLTRWNQITTTKINIRFKGSSKIMYLNISEHTDKHFRSWIISKFSGSLIYTTNSNLSLSSLLFIIISSTQIYISFFGGEVRTFMRIHKLSELKWVTFFFSQLSARSLVITIGEEYRRKDLYFIGRPNMMLDGHRQHACYW